MRDAWPDTIRCPAVFGGFRRSDHREQPPIADSGPAAAAGRDRTRHDDAAEQLAEAKRYGRLSLLCALADKAIDVWSFWRSRRLCSRRRWISWLARSFASETLRLLVVFLHRHAGAHMCMSFPLSLYSGHVLEHRFQLSTQTFGRWLWRYAEAQPAGPGVWRWSLFVALYWLIWTTGRWWWLAAAGAFFVVSVVLGQLMPVLILPLFYKIEKLDAPELTDRIARLAAGTGLSIEGVYRMDLSDETVKANAMLAGLGRTRRVLLGDTLLDSFTPDEIEVIFAHEIGHHVFHHIRKMIVAGVLYSAAGFWICDRILLALGPASITAPIDARQSAGRHAAAADVHPDGLRACCWSRCKTPSAGVSSGSATATRLQRTGLRRRISRRFASWPS